MAASRSPKTLAAAFAISLLTSPVLALPPPDEPWIEVRSPSFLLFSNAGEKSTRRIATDLERLRSALGQLNPDLALSSPQPIYIYVFRNDESFRPYKLLDNGKPLDGQGYFVSHPEAHYMVISGDPKVDERAVCYHEYLHSILRNNYADLPLWLNEGLSEYYSTFLVSATEDRIGTAIREHAVWLRRHPLIPLRELFAMDESSADYNEGDRRGVFYAQSWALVHYLLNTDAENRQRTLAYLQDVAHGKAGPDALRRLLGMDEQVLETKLGAYVRRAVFMVRADPARAESSFAIQVEPLKHADALVRLGELLLRASDEQQTDEAAEHFRAALAQKPDHPRALAGAGRIEELAGHRDEAHALYEKAARLAPDDFTLHLRLAVNLLEPDTDGTRLPQARAALERAVALRPDYAEAWGRLAQTLSLMDLPPAETLHALETAHRLLPDRIDLAVNLALAYAQAGERTKVEELIERALVPRAPEMVEKARNAVLLAERQQFNDRYNRASAYLDAGNEKAALEILEDLVATTLDPGQRQEAQELLQKVRSGLQ